MIINVAARTKRQDHSTVNARVLRQALVNGVFGLLVLFSGKLLAADPLFNLSDLKFPAQFLTEGRLDYNAASDQLRLCNAYLTSGGQRIYFQLDAKIDDSGNLVAPASLVVAPKSADAVPPDPCITLNEANALLRATLTDFDYEDSTGIDLFQFVGTVSESTIPTYAPGSAFGVDSRLEGSTFDGSFDENFTAGPVKTTIGILPIQKLGDFVWEDCNGNGIQDEADCDNDPTTPPQPEPGIPGVTVNLLSAGGNGCSSGDETVLASTTTDANGYYLFPNTAYPELNPGNYCVEFVKPAGYECTLANQGINNGLDSDVVAQLDGVTCQTVDSGQNPINIQYGETDLTWDAGLVRPASLGDFVWNDLTRDDVQSAGDQGLAGVVVTLLDCQGNQVTKDVFGNPINPITTAANGFYEFVNLQPGGYQVQFEAPAGYTFVTPKAGNGDDTIDSDAQPLPGGIGLSACRTLVSGQNDPDIDAGLYEIGQSRLGDLVWNDRDADGIQDNINGAGGEPGIADVVVELYRCKNDTPDETAGAIDSTTTNTSGFYYFEDLTSGSYAVKFLKATLPMPGDWYASPQNQGGDDAKDSDADQTTGFTGCVDLGVNDEDLTLDAGFFEPASLGDFVWDDDSVTRNDVQDSGEKGVAGAVVSLEDCNGKPVTDLGGNVVSPVTTGANGLYQFTNLRPGSYQVHFVPPSGFGFAFVKANQGTDDGLDSDADGTTGLSACTTLVSGENDPTIDAGLYRIAESRLGDLVWNDLNADGIQDNINGSDGEPGIPDIEVELYQCNADGSFSYLTQTKTNSSGRYYFNDLTAGSYAVKFPVVDMQAMGWRLSPPDEGTDDAIDSDATLPDGFTACVTLGVSDENLTLDAGFFKPASLGDFVWDDNSVTRNDVQDSGEKGVAGAVVSLEDCNGKPVTDLGGTVVGPVTTGANGLYQFTNLRPGGYQVRFVPPLDYEFVARNAGPDNVDSDADVNTGVSHCVTLVSGQDDPTIDAGIFLAVPACDVTVTKGCQIIPPPTPGDFVCSDAKPLDELTMILAKDREIAEIRYYRTTYDPNKPADNLIGVISGPIALGDEVTAAGYAAASATNDVDWVITYADGNQEQVISRFHRSCSDSEMNGPEDCGKLEGDGKANDASLANIWKLEGLAGNGLALDCTLPDPQPSTETECTFSTPAPPHCLGKVEAIGFRYLDDGCVIEPNLQGGKAECVLPGNPGEPVRIVVSDGGSRIYLDTGMPGSVSIGDVVTATAANAGQNEFSSNSLIEIYSQTGTLVQQVTFHTSCSQPLNLGDRYGSVEVVSMQTTEGGSVSLGAEVQYDYRFTNNLSAPFTFEGKAVDDVLGTVLNPLVLLGGETKTASKTAFVLPDASNVLTNTVKVTANDGAFCGQASASVTRVPPPPGPVSCSDIKELTALSMVWDGPSGVTVTTQLGEVFKDIQNGNQITFMANRDAANDFVIHLSGAVNGDSVFHLSCSDEAMNGSDDCGTNQGDGKSNDATKINDWLLDGMTGQNGSFACGLPNTGVVDPETGTGGPVGGVTGATVADLSDAKKFKWALTNTTNQDLFVTEITVAWPNGVNGHGTLKKIKLEGDFVKDLFSSVSPITLSKAGGDFDPDVNKAKLRKGDTKNLEIEFTLETLYRDQTDFEVTVTFDNGDVVTFSPAPLAVTGAATLDLGDDKKVKWALTNNTTGDLLITAVIVTWPDGVPAGEADHGELKKMKLAGDFAKDLFDGDSPTEAVQATDAPATPEPYAFTGNDGDRKLNHGDTKNLEIEFTKDVKNRTGAEFTLEVTFSNGNKVIYP